MYRGRYTRRKKRAIAPILGVVALVCVLGAAGFLGISLLGGGYGRYAGQREYDQNQVLGEAFYFTVDLLGDTDTAESLKGEYTLYGGSAQTVTFSVRNYYDSKRYTTQAVEYKISVEGDHVELLQNGNKLTENQGTGKIAGGETASDYYTLSISEDNQERDVTVTIRSTAPYEKEMTLVFHLDKTPADVLYRVEDSSGNIIAVLTVMSNVEIGAGKLQVDLTDINAGGDYMLQVDTTSPYVLNELDLNTNNPGSGHLDGFSTTLDIHQRESIEVRFFKTDPSKNYATNMDTPVTPDTNGVYLITLEDDD